MSTNISRRKVVAGAAWAAPVVAASAVVPAFASSTECEDKKTPAYSIEGTSTGAKTVQKFKVPANVDKINFVAIGGPGGTQYPAVPGGASAQISGTIAVKAGQVVEIVAAAGGVGNFPLDPSEGGEGYGNGGSSKGTDAIPASVVSKVNAVWPGNSQLKRRLFSSSGGGSSAVLIDGVPVAVAGGGGGVGVINAGGSNNEQYVYSGAIDAGWWKSDGNRAEYPYMASKAGSASGLTGGAGEQGYGYYTEDHAQQIAVEAGKGGAGGIGGTGGTKTALPTGKSPTVLSALTTPTTRNSTLLPTPVTQVATASLAPVQTARLPTPTRSITTTAPRRKRAFLTASLGVLSTTPLATTSTVTSLYTPQVVAQATVAVAPVLLPPLLQSF